MRYDGNTAIILTGAFSILVRTKSRFISHARYHEVGIRESKGYLSDVGANTGQHSLFMSGYSKEVHVFEPMNRCLKDLSNG